MLAKRANLAVKNDISNQDCTSQCHCSFDEFAKKAFISGYSHKMERIIIGERLWRATKFRREVASISKPWTLRTSEAIGMASPIFESKTN